MTSLHHHHHPSPHPHQHGYSPLRGLSERLDSLNTQAHITKQDVNDLVIACALGIQQSKQEIRSVMAELCDGVLIHPSLVTVVSTVVGIHNRSNNVVGEEMVQLVVARFFDCLVNHITLPETFTYLKLIFDLQNACVLKPESAGTIMKWLHANILDSKHTMHARLCLAQMLLEALPWVSADLSARAPDTLTACQDTMKALQSEMRDGAYGDYVDMMAKQLDALCDRGWSERTIQRAYIPFAVILTEGKAHPLPPLPEEYTCRDDDAIDAMVGRVPSLINHAPLLLPLEDAMPLVPHPHSCERLVALALINPLVAFNGAPLVGYCGVIDRTYPLNSHDLVIECVVHQLMRARRRAQADFHRLIIALTKKYPSTPTVLVLCVKSVLSQADKFSADAIDNLMSCLALVLTQANHLIPWDVMAPEELIKSAKAKYAVETLAHAVGAYTSHAKLRRLLPIHFHAHFSERDESPSRIAILKHATIAAAAHNLLIQKQNPADVLQGSLAASEAQSALSSDAAGKDKVDIDALIKDDPLSSFKADQGEHTSEKIAAPKSPLGLFSTTRKTSSSHAEQSENPQKKHKPRSDGDDDDDDDHAYRRSSGSDDERRGGDSDSDSDGEGGDAEERRRRKRRTRWERDEHAEKIEELRKVIHTVTLESLPDCALKDELKMIEGDTVGPVSILWFILLATGSEEDPIAPIVQQALKFSDLLLETIPPRDVSAQHATCLILREFTQHSRSLYQVLFRLVAREDIISCRDAVMHVLDTSVFPQPYCEWALVLDTLEWAESSRKYVDVLGSVAVGLDAQLNMTTEEGPRTITLDRLMFIALRLRDFGSPEKIEEITKNLSADAKDVFAQAMVRKQHQEKNEAAESRQQHPQPTTTASSSTS